jgi:hypothetical protein
MQSLFEIATKDLHNLPMSLHQCLAFKGSSHYHQPAMQAVMLIASIEMQEDWLEL